MRRFPLQLRLRGERNYLHGTDLYLAITDILRKNFGGDISEIQMRIPRHFMHPITIDLSEEDPLSPVEWHCLIDHRPIYGRISESGAFTEIDRFAFDEDVIFNVSIIGEREIRLSNTLNISPIEHLIFLNKALHQKMNATSNAKWAFTRLDLKRDLTMEDLPEMTISISSFLSDFFTRAEINCAGSILGNIYFTRISGDRPGLAEEK